MRQHGIKLSLICAALLVAIAGIWTQVGPSVRGAPAGSHPNTTVGASSTSGTAAAGGCLPWHVTATPSIGQTKGFQGVTALSATNVWAVGEYGTTNNGPFFPLVEHFSGSGWSVVLAPFPSGTIDADLFGVAAASATDIWAVGDIEVSGSFFQTLIEHWNGANWSIVPSPNVGTSNNALNGVVAVSSNDVWAVGNTAFIPNPLVEHWNGTSWSVVSVPVPSGTLGSGLSGISAVAADDVWAVGSYDNAADQQQTLIEHWDGTSWTVVPSPNPFVSANVLNSVVALSASDIWAVGAGSIASGDNQFFTLVEHWDGTAWSVVSSPNDAKPDQLLSVSASSATDVWAVGFYWDATTRIPTPLTEHWNGTNWSVIGTPNLGPNLNVDRGVSVVPGSHQAWAVGTLIEMYFPPNPSRMIACVSHV